MSSRKRKSKRKPRPTKAQTQKAQKRKAQKRKARSRRAARQPAIKLALRPSPFPPEALADPGGKRWTRLLTKVDKDPDSALDDPRCLTPHFLTRIFDLCDGKALEAPYVAHDYAEVAIELAKKTGHRHWRNLAAGVAVHAHVGNEQWEEAALSLKGYWLAAFDCCRVCVADWLRRAGDFLVETGDPESARDFLRLSTRLLGSGMDDDMRGRIFFLRGIAHFYQGNRDRALDDAGAALMLVSLASPRGYFLDAVAFIACFLERGDERRHDEKALKHLERFRERIKGLRGSKGWNEVRDRIKWVEGQVHARLDHPHRARARLKRARKAHVQRAPHRWALAIGIDEALLYCRNPHPDTYFDPIMKIMRECQEELKLEAELSAGLEKFFEDVGDDPWAVPGALKDLRRSFIVPVPGLLLDLESPVVRRSGGA